MFIRKDASELLVLLFQEETIVWYGRCGRNCPSINRLHFFQGFNAFSAVGFLQGRWSGNSGLLKVGASLHVQLLDFFSQGRWLGSSSPLKVWVSRNTGRTVPVSSTSDFGCA